MKAQAIFDVIRADFPNGSWRATKKRIGHEVGLDLLDRHAETIEHAYDVYFRFHHCRRHYLDHMRVANSGFMPYWWFSALMDRYTTKLEKRLHKKVFRFDDPLWSVFYPMTSAHCRSRVIALTEQDLKEHGLKVKTLASLKLAVPESNPFSGSGDNLAFIESYILETLGATID